MDYTPEVQHCVVPPQVVSSDRWLGAWVDGEGPSYAFLGSADYERGEVEVVHVLNTAFLNRRVLFGFRGFVNLPKREAYARATVLSAVNASLGRHASRFGDTASFGC